MHSPALGKPQTEGTSRGPGLTLLDLGVTGYLFAGGRDKTDAGRSLGGGG